MAGWTAIQAKGLSEMPWFFERMSRGWTIAAGLLLLMVVGVVDYASGHEVALSIFYLVPVCWVAWQVGWPGGIAMAVLGAGLWLGIDLLHTEYSSPWIHYWNSGVRLGFFAIVTLLLSKLKDAKQGLEKTVGQRTADLGASEAKYRSLYSSMSEGVALHELKRDETGRPTDYVILDVNPAFEALTGIARQRAIGAKASELYGTGQAPYLDTYSRVAESGDPTSFETDFSPMGKSFRISVFSPEKGKFATVFEDVTDRKRAEDALRLSEQRLRLHFEQTPLGVIEWDLKFRVLKWNPSAERIFGWSQAEVLGKEADFIIPPAAREHTDGIWEELLAAQGGSRSTNENATKAGQIILCEWYNTPLVDAQGKVIGVASLVQDITEREQARAELVRKNRDLETLLYVSSHDLREPLRAIQSFANLLNSRYAEQLDAKGQDFLRRVVRGGDRMQRLIDDILVLSRAQRMIVPSTTVAGAAIVHEALDRLHAKIERTGAAIRVADGLPEFHVDKTWAVHAVYNLIDNALKFTRPGEPPNIEIAAYRVRLDGHEEVGMAVRDRGPGVDPEYAERIFDLFQRAVPREIEGTGAGLAIVRQIAEKHGGRAWVQPRAGGGAEFTITFGTIEHPERTNQ